MKEGKVSPETFRNRNQKISGSHKKSAVEKTVIAGAEQITKKQSVQERKAEMYAKAEGMYVSIFEGEAFRLEEMVGQASKDGVDIQSEAKNLFVMWWMAPSESRTPAALSEVAEILGISEYKIHSWLSEQWFIEKIDDRRLLRMKIIAPVIDRVNIIQAMMGDGKAKDILYKQIGKVGAAVDEEDPFADVPDDELDEAIEISGIEETKTGTIRLDEEEQELVEAASEGAGIEMREPIDRDE